VLEADDAGSELTLMMRPDLCLRMTGSTARITYITP
jgi:hypothetical protein